MSAARPLAALAALLLGAGAALAQDLVSPSKVREWVAAQFGAEVLRLTPVGDGFTYRVVVMNPPGDSNAAFAVTTLFVDAKMGNLVSQFEHKRQGYDLATGGHLNREASGPATRYQSFRTR